MKLVGHNSAAMGISQIMADDLEMLLGDEKITFHYVRWHINDYIEGTEDMELEIEGAYMRFLVNLYRRGKPYPNDDRLMAKIMRLSVRVWRRVRDDLISLGKIIARNGCLTNSRFEKERQKRAEEMRKKAAAADTRWGRVEKTLTKSPGKSSAKFSPNQDKKLNEINETPENVHIVSRIQNPESKKENNIILSDPELSAKLEMAAGACLKNAAACPGLLVLSEPRRWLEQGCDLELDILPALRVVGATASLRGRVGAWGYFTQPVADAKARRLTPMPEGKAPIGKGIAKLKADPTTQALLAEWREKRKADAQIRD
jgi:uncharacterized protein YdaU (DUF1376 family)